MYFDELDLEDEVLDGLEAMNFFETTPVQEATIPLLLERRDMIACARGLSPAHHQPTEPWRGRP